MTLDIKTVPSLVSPDWWLPRRYLGATLQNSSWLTEDVKSWVVALVTGKIINGQGPMAGMGLLAVGSDDLTDEFFAALICDVLRQSPTRTTFRGNVNKQFVYCAPIKEINNDLRSDLTNWDYYGQKKILIVTRVIAEDKWGLGTAADLINYRSRRGLPTLVAVSPEVYGALYPTSSNPSVHQGLRQALATDTFPVVLSL